MACNLCPSCRLGVSSKTGRLRWCLPEHEGQRRLRWVLTAAVLVLVVAAVTAAIVLRVAGICIGVDKNKGTGATATTSPFRAEGPFDTEAEGEGAQDRSILKDSNVWYLPRATATDYGGAPGSAGSRARRRRTASTPEGGRQEDPVAWSVVKNGSMEGGAQADAQAVQWHTVKPSSDSAPSSSAQWTAHPRKGAAAAAAASGEEAHHEDAAKDEKALPQPAGWAPYAAQKYTAGQVVTELDANDLSPDSKTSNGTVSGAVRQVWQALDQDEDAPRNASTESSGGGRGDLFWDIWIAQDDEKRVREARARMMKQYMDQSVDPCSDFYAYACGGWAGAHPVPPDKSVFDMFETLREMLDAALRAELTEPDGRPTPPPPPRPSSASTPASTPTSAPTSAPTSTPTPTSTPASTSTPKSMTTPTGTSAPTAPAAGGVGIIPMKKRELGEDAAASVASDAPGSKAQWMTDGGDPASKSDSGIGKNRSTNSADATTKAKWLYQSCMNQELLEARGVAPLLQLLQELGGWPVLDPGWEEGDGLHFDWLALVAKLRLYNNDILIAEWVGPDVKDSDQYVVQLDQTGLGLPTRDYFLVASNAPYLRAYREFIVEVMVLLGADAARAARHADELVAFETSLAQIVASSDDRRNVSQLYRRLSVRELSASVPGIDWYRYLAAVLDRAVRPEDPVVVFALRYMNDLAALVEKVPRRTVADYLLWRFVRHRVNSLGDRFGAAKQRLLHALMGREAVPKRWKTCVAHVNSHMGMALGALFVRKYFDHHSKEDTLEMTREITQSFRETLNETRWIDEETRRLALHKVDSMQLRIGYPDFILDRDALNQRYEDVDIHPDRYFENTLNILRKLAVVEQGRLGTAVNKTLWNTAPAVVNAYYSRNKNQIMFPAGILQPPFYHRHLPRSLNYGGIGVVIGHEVTHGFDDKGRLFDEQGRLMRWWSEDAVFNFHQRARCLINQYSKYSVSELDLLINGENTQGENIADNGGIKQAFRAYERWLAQHGEAGETLAGVNATSRQLFFINFAQVWCSSMRPEAMRIKLKIAVHSPARFRVIGTLSNSKEFAEVFQCPVGSPMNPADKCSVW